MNTLLLQKLFHNWTQVKNLLSFIENDDGLLVPLTKINEQILDEDVTAEAKELANFIIEDMFE